LFLKDNSQKKKHLKNANSFDDYVKMDIYIYISFDKVYLERKVTPIWQALSNILGCSSGNTVSGAT
jgi:hypothetical protein